MPSPRELAAQKIQFQKEQERLFQDLLGVLDALDHACAHWQQAQQDHLKTFTAAEVRPKPKPKNLVARFWVWCLGWLNPHTDTTAKLKAEITTLKVSMTEMLSSGQEGVELIRRSLLDILDQHQIRPLEPLGQPFDPQCMYALGREEHPTAPENTVIKEVVRGYRWGDRILREAQVIVAFSPSPISHTSRG